MRPAYRSGRPARARARAGRVAGHPARTRVHRGHELEPGREPRRPARPGRSRHDRPRAAGGAPRARRARTPAARRGTGRHDRRGSPRRATAAARRRPSPRTTACGAAHGPAPGGGARAIGPSPATDATIVAASAAASSSGGRSPGSSGRAASCPSPGGPTSSSPWPPASAISSARRASSCPRTSARSGTSPGIGGLAAGRGATGLVARRPPSSTRGGPAGSRVRRRDRTASTASRERRHADDLDARRRAAPRRRPSGRDHDPPRRPRRASAATIGRTPGTGRTSPPSDSSPMSAIRPGAGADLLRAEEDPDRDREIERGAGLAQVGRREVDRDPPRRMANPALRIAPRTRSRASWRAASARPTIVNPGSPGATSTSTRMTRPSRPTIVEERRVASTPPTLPSGRSPRLHRSPLTRRPDRRRRARGVAERPRQRDSEPRERRARRGRRGRPCRPSGRSRAATAPSSESAFVNMNGAPEFRALIAPRYSLTIWWSMFRFSAPSAFFTLMPVNAFERLRTSWTFAGLVAEMADRLEHEPDVLQARQVGGHHDEHRVGRLEDAEVDVVEPLVDVDHDVVVQPAEPLEDDRHVLLGHELGGLRRRRREQQVDARVVLDHDLADRGRRRWSAR